MIQEFEDYTQFSDKAKKCVPHVIAILWNRYGKENGITNKAIREQISREKNVDLKDSDVRKIIAFIRDGKIPNLIAGGTHGYYRTNDKEQLQVWLNGMEGRAAAILRTKSHVQEYFNKM